MKPVARIVLACVGLLATGGQAVLAWAWTEPHARKQVIGLFNDIYGGAPPWTAMMLDLGKIVWLLPAVCCALLALALWRKSRFSLAIATTIAVLVLIGMFYAMYPIDLMMKGGII